MSNTLCQYLSLLQTQHHHDYNSCMVSNDFNMSGTRGERGKPSLEVCNLGIILVSTLSFQSHIKSIIKTSFFHLKNISRLRQYLSDSVSETLILSFISSRLDNCNGVLLRLPDKALNKLQYVLNSAARVLTCTKPWERITHHPRPLALAPGQIPHHIPYKVLLLTYKSFHGPAPQYLWDPLHQYAPPRT